MTHLFRSLMLPTTVCLVILTALSCNKKLNVADNTVEVEEEIEIVANETIMPHIAKPTADQLRTMKTQPNPASDKSNKDGWVLNTQLSDEFEGDKLDKKRWFVEGQNGDYYIWKGRAPSQFAAHNVYQEDGKLKIRSQWEPDFAFDQSGYKESGGDPYGKWKGDDVPVTTGAVITNKRFLYGYMEVKSKSPCAAMTAAFWAIGYEQELDIFEQMGKPQKANKPGSIKGNTTRTGIHDWSPPAVRPTKAFGKDEHGLDYNTCEEFHIYGAEWGEDYLTIYRDGIQTAHFTQDELGTDWVLNNPMEIWLDSEVFNWIGVPFEAELPAHFEIEYMRLWQKPNDNLLDRAFYGFEGPILYEDNPKPLDLLPESSIPDDYQKFWLIDSMSAHHLVINEGHYTRGVNSLEFKGFLKGDSLWTDNIVALSPEGAVALPAGDFELSFNIWVDQGRNAKKMYISLENPKVEIPINIDELPKKQWVTVEKTFSRAMPSAANDQMKIEVRKKDIPKKRPTKFFIDEVAIRKAK